MRQVLHPILAALLTIVLAACNTTDVMTPPESIGNASSETIENQQSLEPIAAADNGTSLASEEAASLDQNMPQPPMNSTDIPANTAPNPNGPMLGSPGGIFATQKSIYGTGAAQVSGSVSFLPIIGAPIQAVTPLSQELSAQAGARGLAIKPSDDPTASNMLKGYFSAFEDGGNVSITYVWDVLDGGGNRLTRLQGQESMPGGGGDPWSHVPPEVMRKIASDTITRYIEWKAQNQG